MRRRAFAALAGLALCGLASAGCLRLRYDRCMEVPPHPDCVDAGRDAGRDGGSDGAVEGGPGEHDAGAPEDLDAALPPEAGAAEDAAPALDGGADAGAEPGTDATFLDASVRADSA